MKIMKKRGLAFTIPELVVIITVLSVLMGISFLSFSGYSKGSRDTLRFADLNNIKVALDAFYDSKGKYPETSSGISITYKGITAWKQGVFGKSTFGNVDGINKIPVDPVTGKEYMYSLTESKKEFELAAALEGDMVVRNNLLNSSYAGIGDITGKSLVIGRYNGKILKVVNGASVYVLAIPTIINGDISLITVEDIISNKKLAYNGSNVVAGNYINTAFNVNQSFNYSPSDYLVYDGLLSDLVSDENKRILLLRELQMAYDGTNIEKDQNYKELSNLEIDLINPSTKVKQYSCFLIKNNIKDMAGCSENLTTATATLTPATSWASYLDVRQLFVAGSVYTENWQFSVCDPTTMDIVDLSAGLDTIPAVLVQDTIYRLSAGNYRLSRSVNSYSTCVGIVGDGNVYVKADDDIWHMFGVFADNNIISNINLDGNYGNYSVSNALIATDNTNNSAFSNLKLYNSEGNGIYINGNMITLNNIISYYNDIGIVIESGYYNILNNIISYSNVTGLNLTGNGQASLSNSQLFNNKTGLKFGDNSMMNIFSNLSIYNNSDYGISFGSNNSHNQFNDTRIYNNGDSIKNIGISNFENTYYGMYQIFSNSLNSDSLFAGGGHTIFGGGIISSPFIVNYDVIVTIPSIGGWDYGETGLKGPQSSVERISFLNINLTGPFTGSEGYIYGASIPNQSSTLKIESGTPSYFGTDGKEYNSSKKIGQW